MESNETPPDAYRVLVVDDDLEIQESAEEQLGQLVAQNRVVLFLAGSASAATKMFSEHRVDLVILDLMDGNSPMGKDVIRTFTQLKTLTPVILMTHVMDSPDLVDLITIVAQSQRPHIIDFIDKRRASRLFESVVSKQLLRHERLQFRVGGLDHATNLLFKRRKRFPTSPTEVGMRADLPEIKVDLERLCRSLFIHTSSGSDKIGTTIELLPFQRFGLSSSIVLLASVGIGQTTSLFPEPFKCVVKVGPRAEIRTEAESYENYVKYGVRLEERVELLSYNETDTLGGIVYSLAGGSRGELLSLDEALVSFPRLGEHALQLLFKNKNWYSVQVESDSPKEFFQDVYRVDYVKAMEQFHENLNGHASALGLEVKKEAGTLCIKHLDSDLVLKIPSPNFLGTGQMLKSSPWCLVHGDMHGGNVMLERDNNSPDSLVSRISLIDYRYSGRGPRCLDAAALECAIRIADAEIIARQANPIDGISVDIVTTVFERATRESELLTLLYAEERFENIGWDRNSSLVYYGLKGLIGEPSLSFREYLRTSLLFGLRHLRYDLAPLSQLRVAAWVSAIYAELSKKDRKFSPK